MAFVATPFLRAPPRADFTRYAFAVQYHGLAFLGFAYQGPRGENCRVHRPDGAVAADLRGVESVEGRLRRALDQLVGAGNVANVRVSSRTDRGVHAWRNTFQADIRPRAVRADDRPPELGKAWCPKSLASGLNYYLYRLSNYPSEDDDRPGDGTKATHDGSPGRAPARDPAFAAAESHDLAPNRAICVLSSAVAPASPPAQPPWCVRRSATRRSYAYRILHSHDVDDAGGGAARADATYYHGRPFEDDRLWRIHRRARRRGLDVAAMRRAGAHFVGTHDFTSFRGKGCQRESPVVTLEDVRVDAEPYRGHGPPGGAWGWGEDGTDREGAARRAPDTLTLVTVVVTGRSFLYRQVRNLVACLVEVGLGKLTPAHAKEILEKRDRKCAPGMAPARGLFLVDVEHGDFRF